MSAQMEKPMKIGTEITVRVSLTFQEAPDVHTLLAMTPVRERGKLVRLALERYIAETGHPAGDVEQQINAISTWLRSRNGREETTVQAVRRLDATQPGDATSVHQVHYTAAPTPTQTDPAPQGPAESSPSIKRWLQT